MSYIESLIYFLLLLGIWDFLIVFVLLKVNGVEVFE